MTITEFSNEFDVLYNQVNSNQAPSIDEYEKSVLLTKAEIELVLMYANPRGNKFVQGIDDAPDKQYDFSTLIERGSTNLSTNTDGYDHRSFKVTLNDDMLFLLNESVKSGDKIYLVKPITYYDYTRLMEKPFKYPSKSSVWRLVANDDSNRNTSNASSNNILLFKPIWFELIGYNLTDNDMYKYRYLRYPKPIILTNLNAAGLTILNESNALGCELPEVMHQLILQRAVELATAIYNPSALGNLVGVGNASATNLGVVQSNKERS